MNFLTELGGSPASYSVVTEGSFTKVKRPGHEGDYSSPSSAEVDAWIYGSSPPVRLHGVVLS
jgi:hypothetical protein